ncbi:MAG TPA: hypothetical protein VFH72_13175 [Candidatus Baltobacteraceae bacterium]|nr:hypothetical protein [Candidatus Baltobacteraceae bacterium]
MSALGLRGEHFTENDFEIEERRRIGRAPAKLLDDFPACARERLRIGAIDGPA